MLKGFILLSVLAAPGLAGGDVDTSGYTPEQLAVGAVREIISAQAVHGQSNPAVGYACSLEPLVEAQILLDVWLAGKRVDAYALELWCDTKDTPQTTFRASAVPVKKGSGATLTVCADETNVVRTIEGDVAACFERGQGPER
jgi:hypothetical protein